MNIEKEIGNIKERNRRVELDKAWETSFTRRFLVVLFTYGTVVIFFFVAKLPNPFINSIVPSLAFILSTLTMPFFKKRWLEHMTSS